MIALIANPDSGGGEAGDVAREVLEGRDGLRLFEPDDLSAALATDPARLVAVGGDGSLAPVAAAAGQAGIPFAVIPAGTANDFARAMDIPLGDGAIDLALEGTETRRIDIGRMGDRPFLNAASLGLSPEAASHAADLKDTLGALAYTAGALRAGLAADPVECSIRADDEVLFDGEVWQATVACTGAFGGGSSVRADPADGRLDVVVLEAGSRARLVRHAYGLRAGDVEDQPGVHSRRCTTAIVELSRPEPFNVDGEIVDSGTCRFEVEPEAVAVVVA